MRKRLSMAAAAAIAVGLVFAGTQTASAADCNAPAGNPLVRQLTWQQSPHPNTALQCQMQTVGTDYGYNGNITGSMGEGGSGWMAIERYLITYGFMSSDAVVDGVFNSQLYKAMQKAGNASLAPRGAQAIDGTMEDASWQNWAYRVRQYVTGD